MSRTFHHGNKRQELLFGRNWHWLRNEPKEWRRMYKHKPRRAATRQAISKAMQGKDPVWPLDKKPHIYYW